MKTPRKSRKAAAPRGTARAIWLAGLGALATAEEKGGETLQRLARKGARVQRENRAAVRKLFARLDRLRGIAGARIVRLVDPVADSVRATTRELGIPTRREVVALTRRVEKLTAEMARAKARRPVVRRRVPRPSHHGLVPASTG